MDLIPRNIANFTRQLKRIGAMYDWNHTVDTTDPEYYKWTQWIFLQLYKAGLAEKKEAPVNWCPSCHTVLANEQVIAGACERCGTPVEQRVLSQWFFRITKYAQRLLDNLEWIDWSESTQEGAGELDRPERRRRNPLPRSSPWEARQGGGIRCGSRSVAEHAVDSKRSEPNAHARVRAGLFIPVFTTRPDTIFGATFMVLAPEHALVDWITTPEQRAAVDAYREHAASMDLVTRKKTDKDKTGVFTGAYALNPATDEHIPVWIADYVLMEYGTGAIMAVPGHDERDFEFATKYELPIARVIAGPGDNADTPLGEAYVGDGTLVNSGEFDGMRLAKRQARHHGSGSPGTGLAEARVNYRLHDWCISRQRYWGPPIPIIYCDACGTVPVPEVGSARRAAVRRELQAGRERHQPARARRGVVSRAVPAVRRQPPDARPMSATRSSTARGISCAIRRRTATTSRSIRT